MTFTSSEARPVDLISLARDGSEIGDGIGIDAGEGGRGLFGFIGHARGAGRA